MLVTQKCHYALRAILSLARHDGQGPIKIAQIAEERDIPFRFLEVILSQLKQGGFVESRRGTEGGYMLARKPAEISVGAVVEFIDGPIHAVEELQAEANGVDVLGELWTEAGSKLAGLLSSVSIDELRQREEKQQAHFFPNYQI